MTGCASRAGGRRRGFTLVEVTAVVEIIGVLAGVVMPVYVDRAADARIAAARYAHGSLSTAVLQARMDDLFHGGAGDWPTDLDDILFTQEGQALFNPFRAPGQPVYHAFGGNSRFHPRAR